LHASERAGAVALIQARCAGCIRTLRLRTHGRDTPREHVQHVGRGAQTGAFVGDVVAAAGVGESNGDQAVPDAVGLGDHGGEGGDAVGGGGDAGGGGGGHRGHAAHGHGGGGHGGCGGCTGLGDGDGGQSGEDEGMHAFNRGSGLGGSLIALQRISERLSLRAPSVDLPEKILEITCKRVLREELLCERLEWKRFCTERQEIGDR
jgi:hypothetical protein